MNENRQRVAIGVFFLLFVGLFFPRGAASQQSPPALEECPSYAAWREGAKLLDELRLTYAYQKGPTPEFLARRKGKKYTGDLLMLTGAIGTRRDGTLRVSRSGESLDRNETLERFEDTARVWKYDPNGDESPYPATPDTSLSSVEIHGDGIYYHHFPQKNTGSIWKEWERRTSYPVVRILPPNPATSRLAKSDGSGNVLDFIVDDKLLYRYHLDPEHGMMPIRIEYYSNLEGREPFLYRYFTVEEYTRTENGAFLPVESTVHDLVHKREDGTIDVDAEYAYSMTAYEEKVPFGADEFTYKFPEGTFVRNNIDDTRDVVGENPGGSDRSGKPGLKQVIPEPDRSLDVPAKEP